MNDPLGAAVVLGSLGALIIVVKACSHRMSAEWSRKLVHMGMGVVCLAFPWLFRDPRPVWILAGLACVGLLALRMVSGVRTRLGSVLHGVERVSWGEMYFPVAVATVFSLADRNAVRFVVPIAVLTFADAAGALVGRRWGRHRFATIEGAKTVEGSAAVGLVAFLCAFGPLLAAGTASDNAALIATLIAIFSLLVEAISWRGLDNFFLPMAVYAQLSVYARFPTAELAIRLVALVTIAQIAFIWRRGRFLDDSARLGGTLAAYFIWTIGGLTWLVAPAILMASYVRLMPTVPAGVPRHNLVAVICVGSAALIACVAEAFAPHPGWLWPFTLGFATQQATIAIVRFSQGRPHWWKAGWWAIGNVQAIGLQFTAFWLIDRGQTARPLDYACGAVVVAAATAAFCGWDKHLQLPADVNARWWRQGLTALVGSGAALSMVYA